MKKIKLIALPLAAALCFGVAACTNKTAEDEAPEITGVSDKTCAVGAVYDLIGGIAALDKEDGDITPALEITVDGEKINGFYTTFAEENDYEVKYKVTDSKGHVAEETATVSAIARDVYHKFDLADFDGFEVKTAGAAKLTQSLVGDGDASIYKFKVTGAASDEDAVLTRTYYSFNHGTEYTFKYYLKSNVAGTAKVKVNGGEAVDLTVTEGDNVLTFNYTTSAGANEEDKPDIKVELLFGGLGADIEWEFDKAVAEYASDTALTQVEFTNETVDPRIDNDGGKSALAGSAEPAADKSSATLKITTVCTYGDRWRGGMFIKTGVQLAAGKTYNISFDINAANNSPYDVCILRNQWGPDEFIETIESPANGKVEKTITIAEDKTGDLILYIRSGDNVNEITISDLKVERAVEAGEQIIVSSTYTCKNLFKMFAKAGAPNYVQCVDGKLIFEVEQFGTEDWHNKIESPEFFVDTSGVEFMISFKVTSNAPVLCRWVGPKAGGWDPTIIWQQFNLSESEQVYTFKGNVSNMQNYKFEWQFGFAANQKYENVKIEISDIVICWQNDLLDG